MLKPITCSVIDGMQSPLGVGFHSESFVVTFSSKTSNLSLFSSHDRSESRSFTATDGFWEEFFFHFLFAENDETGKLCHLSCERIDSCGVGKRILSRSSILLVQWKKEQVNRLSGHLNRPTELRIQKDKRQLHTVLNKIAFGIHKSNSIVHWSPFR